MCNVLLLECMHLGTKKEKKRKNGFYEALNECIKRFGEKGPVVIMGDMNARVGDEVVEGVVRPCGVSGKNESGQRLVEFCLENNMKIGNTFFKKKRIHKWTWKSDINGEGALLDYVLVKGKDRVRLVDVNVLRGVGGGLSDHYLVEAKSKMGTSWKRDRTEKVKMKEVVRVSRLEGDVENEEYKLLIEEKWRLVKVEVVDGVKQEWERMKKCVVDAAKRVCGTRKVNGGGGIKRGKSDWWCEEIKMAVRKKRECYESWLQSGGEENWTKYKSVSREVKVLIKEKKNRAAEEWGTKVAEKFRENKKAFYKEVNAVRKERCELEERIKGQDGKEILKGIECDRKWKNHFESLLNGNTRAGVSVERYEEAEEEDSAEVE